MMTTDTAPYKDRNSKSVDLDVSTVHPSKSNLRRAMDADELDRLTGSVATHGVLQPLVVRPHPNRAGEWEIIAGHRRHRAAVAAELATVPAISRNMTDAERDEIMLIENLQRSDLDPVEEAVGYLRLVEHGNTVTDLAGRIGRSRGHVAGRLRLLELPTAAQDAVSAGELTLGEADQLLELLSCDDFDDIAGHYGGDLAGDATSEYLTGGRWAADRKVDDARIAHANVAVRNAWDQLTAGDTATVDLTDVTDRRPGDGPEAHTLARMYNAPDDHDQLDCHVTALVADHRGALSIEPACTADYGTHHPTDAGSDEWARRREARRRHETTILDAARKLMADTDVDDLAKTAIDITARWLDNRATRVLELDLDDLDAYVDESHANRIRVLAAAALDKATDQYDVQNERPEALAAIDALTPWLPDGFDATGDDSDGEEA